MIEINEKIFTPLRKEEESKGIQAESVVKPAEATKPAMSQPAKIAATYVPPQRPVTPAVAPLPPRAVMPQVTRPASTLGDVVRSILPGAKPLESNTLLEDHEEPHIEFAKAPVTSAAPVAFVAPAVAAAPRFIPSIPTNLPGAMPATPEPVVAPRPAPAPSMPVVPVRPVYAPAPVTSYATDPYRESVDDEPAV